jgi:hypothetical protein
MIGAMSTYAVVNAELYPAPESTPQAATVAVRRKIDITGAGLTLEASQ